MEQQDQLRGMMSMVENYCFLIRLGMTRRIVLVYRNRKVIQNGKKCIGKNAFSNSGGAEMRPVLETEGVGEPRCVLEAGRGGFRENGALCKLVFWHPLRFPAPPHPGTPLAQVSSTATGSQADRGMEWRGGAAWCTAAAAYTAQPGFS